MRAVAERHVLGVLARAPRDHLWLFDLNFLWLEASALMRTIAKGLALGTSASAPPINARFDLLNDWSALKDERFCHKRIGFLERLEYRAIWTSNRKNSEDADLRVAAWISARHAAA